MLFQFKLHKLKTLGAFNDLFDNGIFYYSSTDCGHLSHDCFWLCSQLWHGLITALLNHMTSRIEV
jgi:hypothetical protein